MRMPISLTCIGFCWERQYKRAPPPSIHSCVRFIPPSRVKTGTCSSPRQLSPVNTAARKINSKDTHRYRMLCSIILILHVSRNAHCLGKKSEQEKKSIQTFRTCFFGAYAIQILPHILGKKCLLFCLNTLFSALQSPNGTYYVDTHIHARHQ